MELNASYGNNVDEFPDFEGFGIRRKKLKSGVTRFSFEKSSWRETNLDFAIHWSNQARVAALSIVVSKMSLQLRQLLTTPPPPPSPGREDLDNSSWDLEADLFERDFGDLEFELE